MAGDQRFERATAMEARDVDLELAAVEPANQLDHLALGSADVEARQEEGNRVLSTSRHSLNRASEVPLHWRR